MSKLQKRKEEAQHYPLYANNHGLFGIEFICLVQDIYKVAGRGKIATTTILRGVLHHSYRDKKCSVIRWDQQYRQWIEKGTPIMKGFETYSIRDQDLPLSNGVGILVENDVDVLPGDFIIDCLEERY